MFRALRKQVLMMAIVGSSVGAGLALIQGTVRADEAPVSGCECTISGSSSYSCDTPSSCLLGQYKCSVECI